MGRRQVFHGQLPHRGIPGAPLQGAEGKASSLPYVEPWLIPTLPPSLPAFDDAVELTEAVLCFFTRLPYLVIVSGVDLK